MPSPELFDRHTDKTADRMLSARQRHRRRRLPAHGDKLLHLLVAADDIGDDANDPLTFLRQPPAFPL